VTPHTQGETRFTDVESTVERSCRDHAQVIRCYPLRRRGDGDEPFPTLFWLVCPHLLHAISNLERDGGIGHIQAEVAADDALRDRLRRDHEAYIDERWQLLSPVDRAFVGERGFERVLRERGIAGIEMRDKVKCLHAHYAHHLARGSAIGERIEALGVAACTG